MQKMIRVKLVRSFHGAFPKHRLTVKGLGLTRLEQERVLVDTPQVRGMVKEVSYMVKIVEEGIAG